MLKKISSCSCLLLAFFFLEAQNILKINNTISASHEQINGSKLYMIAPEGFEQVGQNVAYAGFVQTTSDNNSIMVKEAAGSYKSLIQTFLTENLTIKGLKIVSQEKYILNGDDATFFKLTQKVNRNTFTKLLLFFGDDDFCVLISSVLAKEDARTEANIKKSLLSVAYKEADEAVQMPKGFSFDLKNSNLKYARSISDAVMYSGDGKTSTSALEKNSFFAGNGILDSMAMAMGAAAFAENRLKKQIKTSLRIETNQTLMIDGLQGQEIVASATTKEGVARSLYQLLLFDGRKYYILYGSTTENPSVQITIFQAIAKTFKR